MRIYSQEKIFYVYVYLRTNESKYGSIGTPYYIGKGHGYRAYAKQHTFYPPKDKSRIVILFENLTEIEAFEVEIFFIRLYGRIDNKSGCLRNRTNGGDGASGAIRSKEQRQKASKEQTGNKNWLGKTHSIETKKKMSDSRKGKSCLVSVETRKKMSNSQKGKIYSLETKKKISATLKGRTSPRKGVILSAETRQKMKDAWIKRKNNQILTIGS